jgi:acylphosphatase
MIKHLNIKVSGRVQGVFFRASTKEKADELGVKGFVKNERDGSVYIEAEGDEDLLQKFVAWCKQGPTHAIVELVDVKESAMRNLSGFDILR